MRKRATQPTNASTELFDTQSEKDSITDLETLRNDQASDAVL